MRRMKKPTRTPAEALAAVVTIAFGGVAARMATHFNVSNQTVSFWRQGEREGRPVRFPAEFCPDCERLTDGAVTCEELRPDVRWDVLRKQCADCAPAVPAQSEPSGA